MEKKDGIINKQNKLEIERISISKNDLRDNIITKNITSKKGITLVALVITIIVLLILAGITISLFSNNGIMEHAKFSKFSTEFREIEERVELYAADKKMEKIEQQIANSEKITMETNQSILPVGTKVTSEEKQKRFYPYRIDDRYRYYRYFGCSGNSCLSRLYSTCKSF